MAVTTYTLELRKGARTLDLMSGRYKTDFIPPAVNLTPQLARGTSANRYGGARKIGQSAADRSLSMLVHIRGQSEREVSAGAGVVRAFLDQAGDESEPVYLVYWPNSDTPEPLWGQGRLYYEVLSSQTALDPIFGQRGLREKESRLSVTLLVKPFALGRKQRLVSAKGAAREDTVGSNFSRGLVIQDGALTNIFTNPVFGHATYDNGWTTAAALVSEKNTDEKFILFGSASARLYCITTATGAFTQSLTLAASTHILSCYAKREDGAAVTSADVKIIYNTVEQTTTFVSMGDGWYLCQTSVTGTGIAAATGVSVQYPRQVYVDGFQAVAAADQRPFFYGDQLGCAWSGTAHASTSTQTATALSITATNDTFREAQGCVRVVWRPHLANTASLTTQYFLATNPAGLSAYYQASDDKFYLTDGTNTVSTAAQTFAAFDRLILHFVWGPSGVAIYKNGAVDGSSANFDPVAATTLYLMSNASSAAQAVGTAMDYTIFGVELTAAQVLDDYNNLTQIAADVERVGALLWWWTKDADDTLDAVDGTVSSAEKDHWGVIGGVPGSMPARTQIKMTESVSTTNFYLSLLPQTEFFYPDGILWKEGNGTADVGASSDDAYEVITVTTSEIGLLTINAIAPWIFKQMAGKEYTFFARIKDAGSGASIRARFGGSDNAIFSDAYTALTGSFAIQLCQPIVFPVYDYFFTALGIELDTLGIQLRCKRSAGSADVHTDYLALMPAPLLKISNAESITGLAYDSEVGAILWNTSNNDFLLSTSALGGTIEVKPGYYNLLMLQFATATVTLTLLINSLIVTPRYALL